MDVSMIRGQSFGATPIKPPGKPSFQANGAHGQEQMYENPISRVTEQNLAIISSLVLSGVLGFFGYGITSCMVDTKAKGLKIPILAGLAVGLGSLAFILPSKLYHTKVGAFAREKETAVFSRDRALQSDLTEQVHENVLQPDVSLDEKLGQNWKLKAAQNGNSLGIADMNA